jgi:hypothetical protein
MQGPWCEL